MTQLSTQKVKLQMSHYFNGRHYRRGSILDAVVRHDGIDVVIGGRVVRGIPREMVTDPTQAPRPMGLVRWRRRWGKYTGGLKLGKVGTREERANAKLSKHLVVAAALAVCSLSRKEQRVARAQ